ncbi:MAG: alpha/beta fold hydrolase [Alphaproteobacteria bacterium]
MRPEQQIVDTRAGRIAFRAAGAGVETLVLLHGLGGNALSWEEQFGPLGETRRAVAWDAPGYGGSDDPAAPEPGLDDYVAALAAFLDALDLGLCDLLGHSMGGIVAARFAARHGGRVRRLVLSCTTADFSPSGPGFAARAEELRTLPAAAFGRLRADGMAASATPEPVRQRLAAVAASARLPGFAAAARMLGRSDNRGLLPGLALPVLVIAGSEDRIAPLAEAERLAALVPGSRLVVVEDAGHAPYAEQPTRYNHAVSAFLDADPDPRHTATA